MPTCGYELFLLIPSDKTTKNGLRTYYIFFQLYGVSRTQQDSAKTLRFPFYAEFIEALRVE